MSGNNTSAHDKVILHHYPQSPFAQKIRSLLAYKKIVWNSVAIPVIMPKAELIALTGGYRKTPVLQCGAEIYCDTATIVAVLEHKFPEHRLAESTASFQESTSTFIDTHFFSVCVSIAMTNRFTAMAKKGNSNSSDALFNEAFAKDRKAFSQGGRAALGMPFTEAMINFHSIISRAEKTLSSQKYIGVGGAAPTHADFSLFHCVWFIMGTDSKCLSNYANVGRWYGAMNEFKSAPASDISGEDAIQLASLAAAQDEIELMQDEALVPKNVSSIATGSQVVVNATDYGVDKVEGALKLHSNLRIVIARKMQDNSTVNVHFPALNYSLNQA